MDGRHAALMCGQLYHGTRDGVFHECDATENRYWPELPYHTGIGGQMACSKSIRLLSSLTNNQMCFPSIKMSTQTIHQAHIALFQQNFALTASQHERRCPGYLSQARSPTPTQALSTPKRARLTPRRNLSTNNLKKYSDPFPNTLIPVFDLRPSLVMIKLFGIRSSDLKSDPTAGRSNDQSIDRPQQIRIQSSLNLSRTQAGHQTSATRSTKNGLEKKGARPPLSDSFAVYCAKYRIVP
jgi:hypothetical protein